MEKKQSIKNDARTTKYKDSVYTNSPKFGMTKFGDFLPLSYKMKIKVSRDEMFFILVKISKVLGAI